MDDKFLIDLDAILDTRFGTVALMGEELVKPLLTPAYANRISDELWLINPAIDKDIYQRAYKDRDLETLYFSAPTDLTVFLNQLINERIRDSDKNDAQVSSVSVEINMYPYRIIEDTESDWIESITASLMLDAPVTLGFHPPDMLTTEYIGTHAWSVVVMYDVATWIKSAFNVNRVPKPIPLTIVLAPHLLSSIDNVKKELEVAAPTKERINPFTALQIMLADVVGFKFLPTADFSLLGLTERNIVKTENSEEP